MRNKIRHQVIPILKEINPQLLDSFNNTISYLKESQNLVDEAVSSVRKDVINLKKDGILTIDIKKLEDNTHQGTYLYELLKDYGFTSWKDIRALIAAQPGKHVMSKTHRLIKDRDLLLLEKIFKKSGPNEFFINDGDNRIEIPGFKIAIEELFISNFKFQIPNSKQTSKVIHLDKDLLKFPLIVRKWKEGDYFYPFGMKGRKKLSKFFKDEKLSTIDKEKIWLLCSGEAVLWVIGHRMDDRFKVTPGTKRILKIKTQS